MNHPLSRVDSIGVYTEYGWFTKPHGRQGVTSMTTTRQTQTPAEERPFANTAEKYNSEHASGKVTVSNFPYDEFKAYPDIRSVAHRDLLGAM